MGIIKQKKIVAPDDKEHKEAKQPYIRARRVRKEDLGIKLPIKNKNI